MKIGYLIHAYNSIPSGVVQKIKGQLEAWKSAGHESTLFILVKKSGLSVLQQQLSFCSNLIIKTYDGKLSRFGAMQKLCNAISDHEPDIVYYRYDLHYQSIKNLTSRFSVLIEINSDDINEYRNGSKLFTLYNKITRGMLLSKASGLIFVTKELQGSANFSKFKQPSIVIGNGISLDDYKPEEPAIEKVPRLFFIGSGDYKWHGLDKLIELAKELPQFQFDVVGKTSNKFAKVTDNIKFYGPMNKEQYFPIAQRATVAISTMAFHRIQLNEASPLKTREYLALGLPVILPYHDTDFNESEDFLLQLPNSESNMTDSVDEIAEFVKKWVGKRVGKTKIMHLDYSVKEKIRLQFFQKIINLRKQT